MNEDTCVETFYCVDCYYCVYTLLLLLVLFSSSSLRLWRDSGFARKPSKCRARILFSIHSNIHVEKRCTSCVTTPYLKLPCPTQCAFWHFMYSLKCCKNIHYNTTSVFFVQFHQTITSALQVYCNTSMHLYYEDVTSINVYIQHATEWSVEVYRQTQALDAAPLSRFPSFLPHRFRLVFRLFYKHLGLPRPCRAPPARGCFRGLLRGSQRSFLGSFLRSFLGSFWTQLELSSHVFDYMTREWLKEWTHSWIIDFLYVSHLRFHIFRIFCARCIDHFALSGLPAGGETDDGKRASHARDVR